MTIDEAIRHAEEVAEEKEKEGKLLCQSEVASIGCLTCAEEHRQLAEWLRDYKRLLAQPSRMKYVQETVNTIMDACNTDKITDKAMRNAARFVQNAIDGSEPEFEALEQEPKTEKVIKMRDATPEERELIDKYIKSISKPTGVMFGALEQEPCDDAISRQAVFNLPRIKTCNSWGEVIYESVYVEDVEQLPSIKPQTGQWIMRHRKVNTINYRTGEDVLTGEIHTVKELIRYETDEPYCACCGKRAEDISQDYCGYCGARMSENPTGSESEDKG